MKEKWFPYRFKTIEEFEKEFGDNWRNIVRYKFIIQMDMLLGQVFPYDINKTNNTDDLPDFINSRFSFRISWDMLISNKPLVPNYEPKKIVRSL